MLLVFNGGGGVAEKLQKLKSSSRGRLIILFNLSPRELVSLLDRTHLFVSLSSEETFSVALLEASSRMVPTISTRHYGALLQIVDRQSGVLLSDEALLSLDKAAAELKSFFTDVMNRKYDVVEMGKEAYRNAKSKFLLSDEDLLNKRSDVVN